MPREAHTLQADQLKHKDFLTRDIIRNRVKEQLRDMLKIMYLLVQKLVCILNQMGSIMLVVVGGEFKRYGSVSGRHGVDGPHVHQPQRNVNGSDIRGGLFNPKKGMGVDSPNALDIKQLYQYLFNGKYQ